MSILFRIAVGIVITGVIIVGIFAIANHMISNNTQINTTGQNIDNRKIDKEIPKKISSPNQNTNIDTSSHLFKSPKNDFSLYLPADWIIPSDQSKYDHSYFYQFATAYGPIHEKLSNSNASIIQVIRSSKNRDDSDTPLDSYVTELNFDQFKGNYINYLKNSLSSKEIDENNVIKQETEINGHEAIIIKYSYQCYKQPIIECKEWRVFIKGNSDSLYYIFSATTAGLFNRYENAIEASFKTFIVN